MVNLDKAKEYLDEVLKYSHQQEDHNLIEKLKNATNQEEWALLLLKLMRNDQTTDNNDDICNAVDEYLEAIGEL
jgi:hypothetical protein